MLIFRHCEGVLPEAIPLKRREIASPLCGLTMTVQKTLSEIMDEHRPEGFFRVIWTPNGNLRDVFPISEKV
jgi:hypothetical protein